MRLRAVLFDIYGTLLSSAAGELHPDPALRDLIARAHAASPHPFPEVDIREIHAALHPNLAADEIEALAIDHERHANPVSPMPGAADTLRQFATRGIPLGLISNADMAVCLSKGKIIFVLKLMQLSSVFQVWDESRRTGVAFHRGGRFPAGCVC
jgi:FMN phosphatase YigB (HAD superfamily)